MQETTHHPANITFDASAHIAPEVHMQNPQPSDVRVRTYIIGIVMVLLVCLIVGFSELVASRGGSMEAILLGASHLPPAAIGILLALVGVNVILKRFASKWQLKPSELASIYVMTVCAALLSSFGLSAALLPNLVGPNYFANPQNDWCRMFFRHLPKWIVPFDPLGPEKQFVAKAYYEGLRQGEAIPWSAWLIPLAAWTVLALLLFFLMACLATLFRRQWADNEKLSFPLVQLPLEIIHQQDYQLHAERKLLLIGALVPFLFHGMNGLHKLVPNVPQVPVVIWLQQFLTTKPWSDMTVTPVCITFSVIGFAYLLPLDVSFSMWFFLLFSRFQDIVGSWLGYQFDMMPLYPAHYYIGYQAVGAAIAVFVSMIWFSRPHFRLVWLRIRNSCYEKLDENEMMSYRSAFWGAIISFLLIILWCNLAGLNLLLAIAVMLTFICLVVIVLTRCVAEIGLLMLQGLFRPTDVLAVGITKASLGAQNWAHLALIQGIFMRDPRTLMPVFMDGMKLCDGVALRRSRLGLAVLMAIPVAIVTAYCVHLWIVYKYGAVRLNTWFFLANPTLYYGEARSVILGSKTFDYRAPVFCGIGLLFTFFLYFMRSRFWWWPFHPLGYAMGAAWPTMVYWSAFLAGWLLKSLLIRYGGIKAFRKSRPFFIGLILGEFIAAIFWATLNAIFGISVPSIPLT
jgi:hypothetical protein